MNLEELSAVAARETAAHDARLDEQVRTGAISSADLLQELRNLRDDRAVFQRQRDVLQAKLIKLDAALAAEKAEAWRLRIERDKAREVVHLFRNALKKLAEVE